MAYLVAKITTGNLKEEIKLPINDSKRVTQQNPHRENESTNTEPNKIPTKR